MTHYLSRRGVLALALSAACAAGCGGGGYDKYVPSEASARSALEKALTAWQNGQRPDQIGAESPAVVAADSKWQAGQKLKGFEILKEEPGEGPKWFEVRLTLQGRPGEQVVRYVVVGKDPLWVYREEDYKKSSKEM
jgi:hypothetical protein